MAKCVGMKRRVFLCMMSVLPAMSMALPVFVQAQDSNTSVVSDNDDNTVTVTSYYTSDSEKQSQTPAEVYYYNNKKYNLRDFTDSVTKETPITEHIDENSIVLNLLTEDIEADEAINKTINGNSYELQLEDIEFSKDDLRTKDIEEKRQYTYDEDIPDAIDVTIKDDVTEKEITVSVQRDTDTVIGTHWVDVQIPMTIYDYDGDYYMLNNTRYELDASGKLDISGKETAILNYLNLSSNDYTITGTVWNGAAYTLNGQICRNVYAIGQRRVQDIEVVYSGVAELPQTYTAKLTYGADLNVSGQYEYEHVLKAVYEKDNSRMIITISILLFLFLLMIVIILFVIAKKKKNTKEKNNNG